MHCNTLAAAAVAAAATALAPAADAGPITVTMTGDLVSVVDQANLLGGDTTWTMSITVDASTTDSNPDPDAGFYAGTVAWRVGTLSGSQTGRLTVLNDFGANGDILDIGAFTPNLPAGVGANTIFGATISGGTALSDDALPALGLTEADFATGVGPTVSLVDLASNTTTLALGTLTGLTVVPTPPAAVAFVAAALAATRR